jgi:hypothetical protein
MRIQFERSGGIAGITVKKAVDTTRLPAQERAELEAMVHAIDFDHVPPAPRTGADRFQYDIKIEDGRRRHVSLTDGQLTPQFRALIDHLTAMPRD